MPVRVVRKHLPRSQAVIDRHPLPILQHLLRPNFSGINALNWHRLFTSDRCCRSLHDEQTTCSRTKLSLTRDQYLYNRAHNLDNIMMVAIRETQRERSFVNALTLEMITQAALQPRPDQLLLGLDQISQFCTLANTPTDVLAPILLREVNRLPLPALL